MQSKSRRAVVAGAAALAVSSFGIRGALAANIASDTVTNNPPYNNSDGGSNSPTSNFNGLNGGTGFGAWIAGNISGTTGGEYTNTTALSTSASGGFDIFDNGVQAGGAATDEAVAIRPFTGGALSPNQDFSFLERLNNGSNSTNGGPSLLGFSLEDSSGNPLFDFHTGGGDAGYYLTDATQNDVLETGVPYNYHANDTFIFYLNDASGDYTFTASGGNVQNGSQTFTGTISMATGGVTQFEIYNQNGGYGSDMQFDNLVVTSPTSPQQWASPASGDWNVAGNWASGVVPNGAGAEADFYSAVTSNTTVYSNSAVTVGTINFNNANEYEITGTGTLKLQASTGDAEVIVQNGTQEINIPTTVASNTVFNVASGASLIIANPLTIDSGDKVTQSGGGSVIYQSIITVGSSASIAFGNSSTANELSVASGGTASIQGTGNIIEVDNLSVGGIVDITKNELLVNYSNRGDPMSTVYAELKSGYNNGGWNGPGIISSSAQTLHNGLHYGVGWADGANHIVAGLSSGMIEMKYTLLGDANLDGTVNGSDFSILAANFGLGVTNWDQGNFLFSSSVNGSDFSALAANFGQGENVSSVTPADVAALDAFAVANGLPLPTIDAVPEPMSIGLLVVASAGALSRRVSRRRGK